MTLGTKRLLLAGLGFLVGAMIFRLLHRHVLRPPLEEPQYDLVDEASRESFPASDPPSFMP